MNPSLLLHDPHLIFIVVLAGVVSMLTTLNVAARPAAVETGRVALAFTISELFFMLTRFANMFYLPLLAVHVDSAAKTHDWLRLYAQIQWVLAGCAVGALGSWLLLPTFVELYRQGVYAMDYRKSMLGVLRRMARPSMIGKIAKALRPPSLLGVRLFHLEGVPPTFLLVNVVATAIWTAGALCAMVASAVDPAHKATAVLLSGMVNAFAAIAFSVWVDPKAALITDQAVAGERPERHVRITAVHLSAGNFLGASLGFLVLWPGTRWILGATHVIGGAGGDLVHSIWIVAVLNGLFAIMSSTSYASRVSAVVTGRVATAITVYNLFFLVTRLTQQIWNPVLGSVRDYVVNQHLPLELLASSYRVVILGATIGSIVACLLLDTFVEIYNTTVRALDRLGSFERVAWEFRRPAAWAALFRCIRRPTTFGVTIADWRELPHAFLWGNLFVTSVYTIGSIAAIYAGAVTPELSRTTTLMSSVVNGMATITISLIVWPTTALMVDQCVRGERPLRHIYATALFLMVGMLVGTVMSQVLLEPAAWLITQAAWGLRLISGRG
jgi:hypothetical protein